MGAVELDAVIARSLDAAGGGGETADDVLDLGRRKLGGNLRITGADHRARRHRVEARRLPARLAAAVDDLGHHLTAVFVNRVGEPGQPGDEPVVTDEELRRCLATVRTHRHVAGDDEPHPTVGKRAIDVDHALIDAPIGFAHPLPGRRAHQTV